MNCPRCAKPGLESTTLGGKHYCSWCLHWEMHPEWREWMQKIELEKLDNLLDEIIDDQTNQHDSTASAS